jgi:hypothetical protein
MWNGTELAGSALKTVLTAKNAKDPQRTLMLCAFCGKISGGVIKKYAVVFTLKTDC